MEDLDKKIEEIIDIYGNEIIDITVRFITHKLAGEEVRNELYKAAGVKHREAIKQLVEEESKDLDKIVNRVLSIGEEYERNKRIRLANQRDRFYRNANGSGIQPGG